MIKLTNNRKQIISLWYDVFGDDEAYINYFLDSCKNKSCLGYFENDSLVSMLFMIECEYCGCKGEYLYAVCTEENYRGRGHAALLVEEAKKYMSDFLWLIPANESLFNYYSKLGFETKLFTASNYIDKVVFYENNEIAAELYDGSEFKYPKGMIYSLKKFPNGDTGMKI